MIGYDCCLAKDDRLIAFNLLEKVAKRAKLKVLDSETKDVLVTLPVNKNSPLAFSNDCENFFYADQNHLQMRQAETGDFSSLWTIDDRFESLQALQISVSGNGRYVAMSAKCGKPKDADPKKWRGSSLLVLLRSQQTGSSYCALFLLCKETHG